jgi:hypothetical protein
MGRPAILAIQIIADASKAQKGLNQTASGVERFATGMGKAAIPAAIVGGALIALGKHALGAASDLQQATGAVESVFGSQSAAVIKFSQTSAERLGIAQSAYQQYAAVTGTALQAAGMSAAQAVGETDKLMTRAADLAATFGGTTASAIEAINAAVSRSEFDPLEKYGISLNMAAVNAELAKRGQDKLTGSAAATAKQAVILEQIYGKSAKAAGQFARESDSAAGAQQIATAQWEDAQAALGEALLPAMTAASQALADMAKFAQANTGAVQALVGVIAGLAAAVLAVNAALKVYAAWQVISTAATKLANSTTGITIRLKAMEAAAWVASKAKMVASTAATLAAAAAQYVLDGAFLAFPLFWIIAGLALVAVAFVVLWKKSETFRAIVLAVWAAVKVAAQAVASFIVSAWRSVWSAISTAAKVFAAVASAVWNVIGAVARAVASVIKGYFTVLFAALRLYLKVWQLAFTVAFTVIRVIAGVVAQIVKALWSAVFGALSSFANKHKAQVLAVFNAIRAVASAVGSFIRSVWSAMWGFLRTQAAGARSAVSAAFNAIRSIASSVASFIRSVWSGAMSAVGSAASAARSAVAGAFNALRSVVDGVVGKVKSLIGIFGRIHVPSISFGGITSAIDSAIAAVQRLIDWLNRIHVPSIKIPGVGKSAPGMAPALGPAMFGASPTMGRAALAGGGNVYITVQGAVDADATARQIERILRRRGRRIGAVDR